MPTTSSHRRRGALPRTLWEAAQRLKALEGGARAVRRRLRRALRRDPRMGGARVPQARSPIGNWRATSRSSDGRQDASEVASPPIDGSVVVRRGRWPTDGEIAAALAAARSGAAGVARGRRSRSACRVARAFVDAIRRARTTRSRAELTLADGPADRASRPARSRGFEERARHMTAIAAEALADVDAGPQAGLHALHPARAARRRARRRAVELSVSHRGQHGRARR